MPEVLALGLESPAARLLLPLLLHFGLVVGLYMAHAFMAVAGLA